MDILYYSNSCKHCKKLLDYLAKNGLIEKFNFMNIDRRAVDPYTKQITIMLDRGTKVVLHPTVTRVPTLILVSQKNYTVVGEDIYNYLAPIVAKTTQKAVGENGEPSGFVLAHSSGGVNIVSETYTMYDASPEELLAKGNGQMRQMHNYASANNDVPLLEEHPRNNGGSQQLMPSSVRIANSQQGYISGSEGEQQARNPYDTNRNPQEGVFYRAGQVVVPELQRPPPHRHEKISGDVTVESLQQKRNEELLGSLPPMVNQLNNAVIPNGAAINVRSPAPFLNPDFSESAAAGKKFEMFGRENANMSMPKLNPEDAREMLFGGRDERGKPASFDHFRGSRDGDTSRTKMNAPYLVNI